MRNRHRGSSKPCPCGGVCSCHKPSKDMPMWHVPLYMMILFLPFFLLALYKDAHPNPVRHIEVNGQDCIIVHKVYNCTSTGACSGKDIAVCSK